VSRASIATSTFWSSCRKERPNVQRQILYRHLRGLPLPVDILVTTAADLARHQNNPGLIYRTILQEGRQLYAA